MKNYLKKKFKNNKIIYYVLQFVYLFIKYIKIIFFQLIFSCLPLKKNKIVFTNYFGKGFGDNSKYIYLALKKIPNNFNFIWLVNDMNSKMPNDIKKIKYGSISSIYHLTTAKVLIDNSRKDFYFFKRKNQMYIQTWHGGVALKKIENDAVNSLTKEYIRIAKRDSKHADIFLSNSKFCTNMYKKSFWYNGEILEIGSPRVDTLLNFDRNEIKKIKNALCLDNKYKILIYAPTFRKNMTFDFFDIDLNRILKKLEDNTKEDWICLVRLHPNISTLSKKMNIFSKKIIDVSNYDDMYEIMKIGDILVTDFSSVMFEFSYMKKPVFLYARDLYDYINDRGFYFELDKLPFSLSNNEKQLVDNMLKFDIKEYNKKLINFFEKIDLKETGNSSTIIANEIIKRCKF